VTGTLALLCTLVGCADRGIEDWMIGVFSSQSPGPSQLGTFQRYRIAEDGDVIHEGVTGSAVQYSIARTWEQDGANAILILPGPDDDEWTRTHQLWKMSRTARCDQFDFDEYIDGENQTPGTGSGLARGELCSRGRTEPCEGECDCCELYWCEPPPPCE
jgi:hypothetical protein